MFLFLPSSCANAQESISSAILEVKKAKIRVQDQRTPVFRGTTSPPLFHPFIVSHYIRRQIVSLRRFRQSSHDCSIHGL
jgi:hypothetical protein